MIFEKFQILVPEAAFTGVVTRVEGTDLDLALDSDFWKLRLAFPLFEVLHCETYGHSGFLDGDGVAAFDPQVGQRIGVSGVLVLDDYVHAEERRDHPERVVQRGLLRAFRPKPELHPYTRASLVLNPPAPKLRSERIYFFDETYSPDWLLNKLFVKRYGVDRCTAQIEVGQ